MKLTYTIEVDVVRETGPNVPKADLSAFIINKLIEVSPQWVEPSGAVHPGLWEYEGESGESEYAVRGWTVYAHEGSEPTPAEGGAPRA